MAGQTNTGLKRLQKALRFSWQGLCAAYRHEEAFRQEIWALIVAVPLAFWLTGSGVERAILIASVLLVMIVELLNSALEAVVDRIGSEKHELSGRAKDMGSAAVLLALVNAVLIWCFILL
ncbi:MAG: diacylglycerol kinase [Thiolinea sp.]